MIRKGRMTGKSGWERESSRETTKNRGRRKAQILEENEK
jgi:hypothetical protein